MMKKITVTITVKQRHKALVWLHTRAMILASRLGIMDEQKALLRAAQKMADGFWVRLDRGDWRRLGLVVEPVGDAE